MTSKNAEQFEKLIAQYEGIFDIIDGEITVMKEKISIDDFILLSLIAAYLGHKLGKFDRETLRVDDILRAGGVACEFSRGSIYNELSTLAGGGKIEREAKGEYKVTLGRVIQFTNLVLPKLKGEKK